MIFTAVLAARSSANCRRLEPHRVRLDAKRRADARTELFGLDHDGGERPHVIDPGADAQVAEHLLAGAAHLDLEVGDGELLAEDRARVGQLRRHPAHRRVEPEAGLDADDHQVERVGQAEEDPLGTASS